MSEKGGKGSISVRKPVRQSRTVKITNIPTESAQIRTGSTARWTQTRRRTRSDAEKQTKK
jgi:5-methylcytosine-specific restriction endonuclease McrA